MGQWLKSRKKRREWRLEEVNTWKEIDKEAEEREAAGEVDDEPEDSEEEEEAYMMMLFEMRRLAWLDSTKDSNDVYQKETVKKIMSSNWIRLIVQQSAEHEKNFDLTLTNMRRDRLKNRSHTVKLMRRMSTMVASAKPKTGSILDVVS